MLFGRDGKASVIIDGQFGSTGKGLIAAWVGKTQRFSVATTNASANAGHTAIVGKGDQERTYFAYHLPMAGVMNPNALLYLNAGAIIDPDVLRRELEQFRTFDVESRLYIHPRAAVITKNDITLENAAGSAAERIASTQHGVGMALAHKVLRKGEVAERCSDETVVKFIGSLDINSILRGGGRAIIEVPQGFSLGINSGLAYPYCTSRDVTVAQALADSQIHPLLLGDVLMTLRTYPIRVGNIVRDGKQQGWSGPWYEDQTEIEWSDLGLQPELTTVTKRPRRIATFSKLQYQAALASIRPTHVFLNFVNYLRSEAELIALRCVMAEAEMATGVPPPQCWLGIGPRLSDIYANTDLEMIRTRLRWV